ncbi:MAG: helix-turn-helix transcriptional regulator [Polyangiaceae bacterium]
MIESQLPLASLALQVVQPGSRQSFRRRVLDALRSAVPASAAFFCIGTDDSRAYGDSSRVVDGSFGALDGTEGVRLTSAFGFDVKSVAATARRVYRADELYPASERVTLPYFATHPGSPPFTETVLVFLHEGGLLFGVAGLERRDDEGPFSDDDLRRLEELAPFVIAGTRAHHAHNELAREAAALRALGNVGGALVVIDRDRRLPIWAVDRQRGIDWAQDIEPNADAIVSGAEKLLGAKSRGEALPTPPALSTGTLTAVAKVEEEPVFGGARCAVVRFEPMKEAAPQKLDGLSKREREVARLLVAGYSGVNVAAIAGLSENTVRTYVRRLYAKLGVANRADLVRKLVTPDVSPVSSHVRPPDSSLVHGDDTLDAGC